MDDDTICIWTQPCLKSVYDPTEAFFSLELFLGGSKILSTVASLLRQHQLSCYKAPHPFPQGLLFIFASLVPEKTGSFLLSRQVDPCTSYKCCICYFSHCYNKVSDRRQLKERKVSFCQQSDSTIHPGGEGLMAGV